MLVKRIVKLVKGWTHDNLDKLESVSRNARQGLRELDEQLKKSEEAYAEVRGNFVMLKEKLKSQQYLATKWGMSAKNAKTNGNIEEARRFLSNQLVCEKQACDLEKTVKNLEGNIDTLLTKVKFLSSQRDRYGARVAYIESREKIADLDIKTNKLLNGLGQGNAIDLNNVEDVLLKKEGKAKAFNDLALEKIADPDDILDQHEIDLRLKSL